MEKQIVQKLITDFYKPVQINKPIIRGYNSETNDWHCLGCGIAMGQNNPRQYCRKTWCPDIIS